MANPTPQVLNSHCNQENEELSAEHRSQRQPPRETVNDTLTLELPATPRNGERGGCSSALIGSAFRCIVADPPWLPTMALVNSPASGIGAPKASPQRHYKTMSVEEICALRPPSATQSHLWLWCLNQHTDWGHAVAKAWGFEVFQMVTWCKPGLGTGRFQCNSEQVLLCRKGTRHGNPFGMTGGTYFNWPRGRHSEKPDAFYDLVERVSPGPRLEMFARTRRLGWSAWGNEIASDVEMPNTKVSHEPDAKTK